MEMSNIINARVTFRNSPIHILEKFTFKDLDSAYESFKKHSGLNEIVILQTCNRVEIFGSTKEMNIGKIKKTWASLSGLEEVAFNENFEISSDDEVYEHLLKLTSGLDSMVLGEEQILGQVKEAMITAKEMRTSGEYLNTLFDKAIKIGTRVRNATGINKGTISVGSMAVKLAEENIDDLKTKNILLIGTGEAATLVAKSLNKRGYRFFVTSRTLQRSQAFSETVGGIPIGFEDVLSGFSNYDVLFVATIAPYFLVTYDRIRDAMKTKKTGMMILDLSNPRTVDEKVATIGGIKMMNLDQIAEMVDKNIKYRSNQRTSAEKIINEEAAVLRAQMRRLEVEPVVKEIFKDIDMKRAKELEKALRMLGETDQSKIKIIDDLTKAIVEGIISTPMNNLRRASEQEDEEILSAATKIFDYKKKD
ncbi:MAG: glutamyl-tRNA reductase [Candidatus Nitrosotenuis sp.]|uniref:Glutamyl-tRNA reductase n=1 Tax=Candidatus Nitrosotenuis uzonensis TaxID=1407055 RepID=A0A812F4H0_9ARCH|nr:glutamyl-tRNA reductase [Candidatus Nitrosotenuis uzonensis]CAE6504868.1 Glutamyl-tRNA reductase [Candidatus Nitrosotenuis uzonensis]